MPKNKSWLFCVFLLAALAGDTFARAESTAGTGPDLSAGSSAVAANSDLLPSKSYLRAYESMATADRLREREMKEDATVLYDEALRLFQQLSSSYPTWQTNLVAFRINYCREELDKMLNLKKAVPEQRNAAVQPAVPPPPKPLPTAEPAEKNGGINNGIDGKIREAAALEKTGDFKGALELYKAVLAQNNQHLAALGGAGRCFLRLGMVDEARDILFQWCVIPSPDNSINSLLALILCHDRQYQKAIQLVEITLNEDNSNAAAHVIMGAALAGMGEMDAAISEMQKALALNPRLSEAHYNLACLMLKKEPGKISIAAIHYQNALKFGATPDPVLTRLLQK